MQVGKIQILGLIIKIIAKTKTIQLNKVSAEPPWKIQGKVKEIIIEKDSETSFSIKFAKQLDQNVVIKIGLKSKTWRMDANY